MARSVDAHRTPVKPFAGIRGGVLPFALRRADTGESRGTTMMPAKRFRGLLIGSLLALGACGTARLIHRDQAGGVLELEGDRGKAMEQANQEMAQQCGPNNFTIMQEGEEPVGTDTIVSQDQTTDESTAKNGRRTSTDTTTTTTQSTRTATVWRVHYQCGSGQGVGIGAPTGGEPPPPPAAPPPPPPAAPPPPP
jgi:hypothetical protein